MLNRRVLLKSGALAMVSLGAGPRFLGRLAQALSGDPLRPKVVVPIFLRGAMDGLMAVPPLADDKLRRWRPRLAMKASSVSGGEVLDLNGVFGLHPAFSPWLDLWTEGRLAIVHGVGSPHSTRSHFDAQDFMETGTPGQRGTPSGWLNRVAAASGAATSPFRAVSLSADLPRSLYGDEPAMAIDDLGDISLFLPNHPTLRDELTPAIETLYRRSEQDTVRQQSQQMFDALRLLSQDELAVYRRERGSRYPSSDLGQRLMQIAFLIQAGVGLEIACVESDGWDTHVGQGTVRGGFASRAHDLATAVRAFWDDIKEYHEDVVVLTMTEFGRTVQENGTGGTDHGHGSCLFVLGNRVDGGKIYGSVPSLEAANLYEGRDLPVTTDFRSVFLEVAGKHLNVADRQAIFPGWQGNPLPLLW